MVEPEDFSAKDAKAARRSRRRRRIHTETQRHRESGVDGQTPRGPKFFCRRAEGAPADACAVPPVEARVGPSPEKSLRFASRFFDLSTRERWDSRRAEG